MVQLASAFAGTCSVYVTILRILGIMAKFPSTRRLPIIWPMLQISEYPNCHKSQWTPRQIKSLSLSDTTGNTERPSSRTPRVSSELPTVALGAVVSPAKKQNIPAETCAYATYRASLHDESELLHHEAAAPGGKLRASKLTYTVSELGTTHGGARCCCFLCEKTKYPS